MKKALRVIGNTVLWLFVIFSALLTLLVFTGQKSDTGLPQLFGKMPISVLSDSMKDTFKTGDLIISKTLTPTEKQNLQVGDVITFFTDLNDDGNNEVNTHRIVDKTEQNGFVYYATRGDNKETNVKNDEELVRFDMVIGQYTETKIPGLGSVLSFLQTSTGFMVCIVVPLILFFLFELYRFIVTITLSKKKDALSESEKDEIKQKAVEEYLRQQAEEKNTPTDENTKHE